MLHPIAAVDRRRHRRDRRRAARRGPGAVRVRVLAAARRHADGDHPRADRRAASGDLGRSHGRGDRPAARAPRADRARRLVGRTARRCSCSSSSTAGTTSTATTSRRARSPPLDTEPGSITAAAVRPDGEVWYRVHNGAHPATLLAVGTRRRRCSRPRVHGARRAGRSSRGGSRTPTASASTGSSSGPAGDGPYPVMMRVHGGPHSIDMDRWAPDVLAHVDAGFLVAMVNYRGSDGFGQAWRDELTGNVGFLEVEDVLAGPRRPRRARARRSRRGSCSPAGRGAATSR